MRVTLISHTPLLRAKQATHGPLQLTGANALTVSHAVLVVKRHLLYFKYFVYLVCFFSVTTTVLEREQKPKQ